jgi:hypothetical protein
MGHGISKGAGSRDAGWDDRVTGHRFCLGESHEVERAGKDRKDYPLAIARLIAIQSLRRTKENQTPLHQRKSDSEP